MDETGGAVTPGFDEWLAAEQKGLMTNAKPCRLLAEERRAGDRRREGRGGRTETGKKRMGLGCGKATAPGVTAAYGE